MLIHKKQQEEIRQKLFDDRVYRLADRLFWIFIEKLHPRSVGDFIEADPDNLHGTRNTEKGRELFDELESFVRNNL
jgi:hypothetical protein